MNQLEVIGQLRALGVKPGGVLVVHTSFRNIRPIEGGVEGLIEALQSAVGADGTLVMPSMSYEDDLAFSPTESGCPELGVVVDTFWRLPGVLRSDSPHAFAARGPLAAQITAPHPPTVPHGLDSPIGRVYELDGQVLLLGVGYDSNTTVHLAENLAPVPYSSPKHCTILRDGKPLRIDYAEVDHCTEKFALVEDWLTEKGLQNKGSAGHGEARLCRSQDLVRVALEHLAADKLVFLHEPGVDVECDEARASVSA